MSIQFDADIPVYRQIVDRFKRDIASGALPPGARVLPVRELAADLGVNPNTLQRSLSELERDDLLYSERTAGRFVTTDTQRIAALRDTLSERIVVDYVLKLHALDFDDEEILSLTHNAMKDVLL